MTATGISGPARPRAVPTDTAAIILAAGASRRMGSPKARLVWKGKSFLHHMCNLARAIPCAPILVVDGAENLSDLVPPDATRVHNADWSSGQLASLQAGFEAMLSSGVECRHILVLTVDRPRVDPGTVHTLIAAARKEPLCVWQPTFDGRKGHPIVYPLDLARLILGLKPPSSARDLLRRPAIASRRRRLPVDDPAVLENFDAPGDLSELER